MEKRYGRGDRDFDDWRDDRDGRGSRGRDDWDRRSRELLRDFRDRYSREERAHRERSRSYGRRRDDYDDFDDRRRGFGRFSERDDMRPRRMGRRDDDDYTRGMREEMLEREFMSGRRDRSRGMSSMGDGRGYMGGMDMSGGDFMQGGGMMG